ncbi:hypothetical protein [Desertivirga arenae]|uniref:hypothetical protein n=1 Tax=Desertivirga arenae TaxID=2810309 RepID=UPI001A97222A|nr:hypothetical protein [Pedobacter sp. SYSU D00823]
MKFDEIKRNWDQEDSGDMTLPKSISEIREAKHPIEKLKRNMRLELIMQVVTLVLLPLFFGIHFKSDFYEILWGVYAVFLLISFYYSFGFYKFYKSSLSYFAGTKDSLYELYYELKLNMERYRSLGFLCLPFVIILAGLSSLGHVEDMSVGWQQFILHLREFLVGMIIVSAIYIWVIILWVNKLYGTYVRQLREILDELKEEENR